MRIKGERREVGEENLSDLEEVDTLLKKLLTSLLQKEGKLEKKLL